MAEQKGVKSMRRAVLALVAAVVIAVSGVGLALFLRSEVVRNNAAETCKAIRRNNDILRDFLAHVEHRSLVSIREGVTQDITAAQVRSFYRPTLARIDAVSC
jgi:hypothetical protein